jgi:hypothetical protein
VASIVIDVPEELKDLQTPLQAVADLARRELRPRAGAPMNTQEVQKALTQRTAEIECVVWRALLMALDVDAAVVRIAGQRLNRIGRSEATFYTPAGAVEGVPRTLYREAGVRNGKAVDPIAVRTGAVAGTWLPCAAKPMAHLVQMTTAREAEVAADQLGRCQYSRSSYERVAHAVGEAYVAGVVETEEELLTDLQVPVEAKSVSLSIDRVTIPMEEPKPRPRGRPRSGAPKRPVQVAYRSAYAATMTFHDGQGQGLKTIRMGRMPGADPDELAIGVTRHALAILERMPQLALVLLADGAHEMWDLLLRHLPSEVAANARQLIDFWHLVEKLSKAAALLADGPSRFAAWKRILLTRSDAAMCILGELVASGAEFKQVGDTQPVHDAITYLRNHRTRMDYVSARADGLPIGSGNVEATCKSLFAQRFKRPGARWHQVTGEEILQLRAAALSGWWNEAMDRTLAPRRQAVLRAA